MLRFKRFQPRQRANDGVLNEILGIVDLPIEELKGVEGPKQLSILQGFQQGTNFKVTEAEAEILVQMV